MAESDTAQVAADLTRSILGEFVAQGEEHAADLLNADQGDAAPPPAVSTPAPAAETADAEPEAQEDDGGEAEEPTVDYEPQLSDELRQLLEEPDFEEEAAAEVAAAFEAGEFDETVDPEVEKEIRALRKRNEFLEARVVQASKGKWVAENLRAYPLLATYAPEEIQGIEATSRRAFAREAAKLNDRYTKMLKPALEDVARLKEQAKTEALAEARQQASAQWGLPVAEPVGSGSAAMQSELQKARAARAPLHERIKILAGLTKT